MDGNYQLTMLGMLVACLVVVGVFVRDYAGLGRKTISDSPATLPPVLQYKIIFKNKDMTNLVKVPTDQMPCIFGRQKESANNVTVNVGMVDVIKGLQPEASRRIHQFWFVVDRDGDKLVVYPLGEDGKKTGERARYLKTVQREQSRECDMISLKKGERIDICNDNGVTVRLMVL